MNILQVNAFESPGRRFHGLSITPLLKQYGIDSRHLVWHKDTKNPEILTFKKKDAKIHSQLAGLIEEVGSLQSMLYQNVDEMINMKAFKEADLIHLHIIHTGYLNVSDIPIITKLKPTVWTLHDPWALTGHCVHPFDCKGWMTRCGNCPDLNIEFPILQDTTRFLFNYKDKAYKASDFDIIVASKWMQEMVQKSPLFEGKSVHHIPFGLNLDFFSPDATTKNFARDIFGIDENVLVLCFRADNNPFKGLHNIVEALKAIKTDQKICLLLLGHSSGLVEKELSDNFQIINLGWINNEEKVRNALIACDIFLMPSLAETFGLMAIEAMACGKPIIVFDETALSGVTFAPEIGISVPMKDSGRLARALQHLIDDPNERKIRGDKGRIAAKTHYGEDKQARQLAEVYKSILARHFR